jgi:hypothetical protein
MTNIFVSLNDQHTEVIAMGMRFDSNDGFMLKSINRIEAVGNIHDMFVSPNGQHLFNVVDREQWEISSMQRYLAVCLILMQDPDNVIYKSYRDQCANIFTMPRLVDVSHFVTMTSSCSYGMYCPSFTEMVSNELIIDGLFLHRSTSLLPCPKGFICKGMFNSNTPFMIHVRWYDHSMSSWLFLPHYWSIYTTSLLARQDGEQHLLQAWINRSSTMPRRFRLSYNLL